MMGKTLLYQLLTVFCVLLFSSCNGMFEGIYDSPDDIAEDRIDTVGHVMHVENLNVLGYSSWIYLDLHKKQFTDTLTIPNSLTSEWDGKSGVTYYHGLGSAMTFIKETHTDAHTDAKDWDIAIHHFDVKTNGCGAIETSYTSLDQLPKSSSTFANAQFTYDEWTTNCVLYDISKMYTYNIGYQNTYVNKVLSNWVTMDFSSPPPVYSMSGKVYVLRLNDGTYAALLLTNYMNRLGTKGYLTFDIIYPY